MLVLWGRDPHRDGCLPSTLLPQPPAGDALGPASASSRGPGLPGTGLSLPSAPSGKSRPGLQHTLQTRAFSSCPPPASSPAHHCSPPPPPQPSLPAPAGGNGRGGLPLLLLLRVRAGSYRVGHRAGGLEQEGQQAFPNLCDCRCPQVRSVRARVRVLAFWLGTCSGLLPDTVLPALI